MLLLADLLYLCAAILYLPRLLYETTRLRKNRTGWRERFAHLRDLPARTERIWIHAVSVGEMNATQTLIPRLAELRPNCDIVISTTTDTGYARGRELYPNAYVFRFPLDFSRIVRRALDRIKPTMIVLVELELWHNLGILAQRQHIPVVVFNGRLSERSRRRFNWIRPLARPMFARLAWVGAQDETYAQRFKGLGTPADRVQVVGSVKYDTAPTSPNVAGTDALRDELGLKPHEPLWVCGSTGPGEERIILDAYAKRPPSCADLRLAIVPRKPERFDEVAGLIESAGFACLRRSTVATAGNEPSPNAVILGDTMGELRKFYALASVVFVGRSLVPLGGSDVIEAAALACPILVGPHTDNFADAVRQLDSRGALRITDAERLSADLADLLADADRAAKMGANARALVGQNLGATRRTTDALLPILDSAGAAHSRTP